LLRSTRSPLCRSTTMQCANIDVDQLQRRGAATKNRRRGQPTPGIVLCAVIVILLIYNSMH